MNWTELIFKGRIGRTKYWLFLLAISGLGLASVVAIFIYTRAAERPPGEEAITSIIRTGAILFFALQLGPNVVVTVKRLHDRNKSGWWILFFTVLPQLLDIFIERFVGGGLRSYILYAPGFAISVWMIVELCFLRGTIGPNRFGDDPLSPRKNTVTT